MKSLILLIALLLVGCAATDTDTPPPEIPMEVVHAQVLEADQEWVWFTGVSKPSKADAASVKSTRNAYEKSLKSGDDQRIRKAAQNYIGLVNSLMVPPLEKPKK